MCFTARGFLKRKTPCVSASKNLSDPDPSLSPSLFFLPLWVHAFFLSTQEETEENTVDKTCALVKFQRIKKWLCCGDCCFHLTSSPYVLCSCQLTAIQNSDVLGHNCGGALSSNVMSCNLTVPKSACEIFPPHSRPR